MGILIYKIYITAQYWVDVWEISKIFLRWTKGHECAAECHCLVIDVWIVVGLHCPLWQLCRFLSLSTGHWSLVTGHLSPVTGHWSLPLRVIDDPIKGDGSNGGQWGIFAGISHCSACYDTDTDTDIQIQIQIYRYRWVSEWFEDWLLGHGGMRIPMRSLDEACPSDNQMHDR